MELRPISSQWRKRLTRIADAVLAEYQMRFARPTFLLGLLTVLFAALPPSCNTKAVGIDECRDIEYARCESGVYCKTQFAVDDVSACKRFYRDQCLHGLDVSQTPGKPEVTQCVETIKRLGRCAKKGGEDALIADCSEVTSNDKKVLTVCQLMKKPEAAPECAFLVGENGNDDSSGGASGAAGSAGTSGEAGTAGASGGST